MWGVNQCKHHQDKPGSKQQTAPEPRETGAAVDAAEPGPMPSPEVWKKRDLRGLAWWAAEHLLNGTLPTANVTALNGLMRVLIALGDDPSDEADVLAEIELRGIIMHGMPPRDEEEWALAERVFDADAIAEFRRWDSRLTERYPAGTPRPIVGWEQGA